MLLPYSKNKIEENKIEGTLISQLSDVSSNVGKLAKHVCESETLKKKEQILLDLKTLLSTLPFWLVGRGLKLDV